MNYSEPKLGAPGAGIPWHSRLVAKYFVLPHFFKKSWQEANALYQKQLESIAKRVQSTPEAARTLKVLVTPIQGLEDSSRYWSLQMVLEHLNIVGDEIAQVVVLLSNGKSPHKKADTAKVKPLGQESFEETWSKFSLMTQSQLEEMNAKVADRSSKATFAHPWFGPLTAHQWNWMLGIHASVHLTQIKQIIQQLNKIENKN